VSRIVPGAQDVHGAQAAALAMLLNVRGRHEEQSRLVVAAGLVETYCPATQVENTVQPVEPDLAYEPAGQA
jgi:hypothetical protein